MNAKQSQIKLNIPTLLKDTLSRKASKYGMPLAGYLRFLILKDVDEYPVYEASIATEKAYKAARKEEKEGKLIYTDNVEDLLKNL